jgi:methyl-accepting chemotaxis protein
MSTSLVTRVRLIYLPLDLIFGVLIPLAVVNGIKPADTTYAVLLLYGLGIGRTLGNLWMIGRVFGPIARWLNAAPPRPDARELREIDEMIRRGPSRITAFSSALWVIQLMAGVLVLRYGDAARGVADSRAIVTTAVMAGSIILGSIPFTVPLMSILMHDQARRLFTLAHSAAIPLQRERTSLKLKLVIWMACTGIAGPLWMSSIADWSSGSMAITLVMYFLVIIAWAPMCAYFLAIDVVRPLEDITRTVQQITDVGKLDEVSSIPVTQNDETGVLASRFNDLLDMLRDLSAAASALARGDLEIRLRGEGDVATAFRSMIESLGQIVRQIHETSVLLAAAATEIYAASQEQEAAAASQSTAMVEIRQTMESLFEAAAHVSESVRGVLSNAERTLETTDRMVIRIGDLTNHAGRIGEILETIRDISDRSDLLALNGALEASRAGEAGRGFGLVAAEMRRLAERVLTSVHDVRALVGDIRASGSSTMMATEDSKKLAASTTDAARQITMVTQQQRSGTEQVLQSVREIAETLAQSVAAMAQTRASAEQLKSQADKLSSLVRAFRIETTTT